MSWFGLVWSELVYGQDFEKWLSWKKLKLSDETIKNKTSPSGILHFAKHHLRAYQKNFQLFRTNGSRDNGSGKFIIWKSSILGFFLNKLAINDPKRAQLNSDRYPSNSGPQWFTQKNVTIFGWGVIKCVHANWTALNLFFKYPSE